ncbi:glycosyl transferase [Arthrobacter sp. AFG7.2]|nr:glycosyl transferase [Arthrobacter sp. AFG7.2]
MFGTKFKDSQSRATKSGLRPKLSTVVSHLWRGPLKDPAWERPALLALLATNAVLYVWNLGINGWANFFYSAAVQSGTMDAKAFFFGSSDWGNSITVDKPPLSLWVMGISVKLFGFNPVAMLAPQVLMGVGTTLLIYMLLRRYTSAAAALFGAVVFFTTPIVTLMSRYNNPDPLMLLLMVAAAWFVLRSIETGHGGPFVVAGALLGLAFMTKQMQGMLSVPALGLSYLVYSPISWPRRLRTAASSALVLIITGGLWMTIVDLIPENARPYVGGSASNSVLELTLAYNGVERIVGGRLVPAVMQVPGQFRPVDSDAGIFRLFNANYNQEASWLLLGGLLALILLVVRWKASPKSPPFRALVLISGVWFLTAFLLLSFMGNQIHTYYTAAIAPPLALVLGVALHSVLIARSSVVVRLGGAICALAALLTTWLVLAGTSEWPTWLPNTVLTTGIIAISALIIRPPSRRIEIFAAVTLVGAVLSGPAMTSVHNVTLEFNGSNPLSGVMSKNPASISHLLESLRKNEIAWGHDIAYGRVPDLEVIDVLARTRGCTWSAATYASQTAARLQLESGRPVMPLGGFAGSDPSPTLEEFINEVEAGNICYMVQQEAFLGVQATESASTAISAWVESNFQSEKLGDTTVYRLTDR